MSNHQQKSRTTKLGKLTPEQQQAVFAYCENKTIAEGIQWLKKEFHLTIGTNTLSRWLRGQRAERSAVLPGRKTRPDCKLGMLKPEQQEEVYKHCGGISLDEGVRWIQEELDVEVSSSSLGTWLRKRRIDKANAERLEEIRNDSDRATLVGKVFGAAAALTEANTILFAQAVFEEFLKPVAERDEKRLVQYMNIALKGRTVGLAYSRHHFDAAKSATEKAAELQKINAGDEDETEKIEKAMVLLFGEEPSGFTSAEEGED
jgi:transposase